MKTDEIKLRIVNFANTIIDMYIPETGFAGKVKNATAKFWVDQNVGRLDGILQAFADVNGCIDTDKLINTYENVLFPNGELRLDVKEMLPEHMIALRNALPDKIIILKKEDLYELFDKVKS